MDDVYVNKRGRKKCFFIKVHFQHNDVCITQYMCHIMILIHECYMIKDESNKSSNDILVFLSRKGLDRSTKSFLYADLAKSTVM
jgi:hypothetical protein